MLKKNIVLFCLMLMVSLFAQSAWAEDFPTLSINGELSAADKAYLGIDAAPFGLEDVDSSFIFVELYSMYCPICQRDAEKVNALCKELEKKDVKFIGLGIGNTPYEISFYDEKFSVPFPLFPDEEYKIHKLLGDLGTPSFFLLKKHEDRLEVVLKHTGALTDDKAAYDKIIEVISQ